MPTALQLVNRVRRRGRTEDAVDFSLSENKLLRDLVNEGKNQVLQLRDWDFDVRHDGALTTVANSTGSTLTLTPGTQQATINEAFPTEPDSFVGRLVITSDDNFGDTAFRVSEWTAAGVVTVPEMPSTLSTTTPTYSIFANEYVLPASIRKITSVRHQESDVRVEEINRRHRFDRFIQRPQETIDDQPSVVFVGGTLTPTTDGAFAAVNGLGFMPWPTPSSQLRFHFSYIVAHDDLDLVDDTLDDVDPQAVDLIVEMAYAKALQSDWGTDRIRGLDIENKVRGLILGLQTNETRMPAQRMPLRSLDRRSGSGRNFGGLPQNFGSL